METVSIKPLTKRKKLIFALLLLAFSIILTEIGLQVFYRVTAGQWLWQWWAVPLYESDDFRVYRVKRNLDYLHKTSEYTARYYTNAQGFRTDGNQKPTSVEKPTNNFRVMYLGPSFAFGWGVDYEQSYAYLISQGLHILNKRIESINVGTPAQPMNYQLAWFKKQGYQYAPDLIVQTVYADCCENIATDGTLPKDLPYVDSGYLYTPPSKTLKEASTRIILKYRRYSALLYFGWRLYGALSTSKEANGIGEDLYEKPSSYDVCKPDIILEKYIAYQQFVWSALNKKVPIVFLYVPLAYIVRPADIIRVKHHGGNKDPLAERLKTKKVQQMLNENGVNFVDLTDSLIEADGKTRMYHLYDIHFTPEGNKVAADAATPKVQKVIDESLTWEKGGHIPEKDAQSGRNMLVDRPWM